MDIAIARTGASAVVTVSGELDANTAPEFEDAVAPLVGDNVQLVVVDVSDLEFLDSSGLRVLVRTRELLMGKGGTVELRSPSVTVRRVLEITRLEDAFGLT